MAINIAKRVLSIIAVLFALNTLSACHNHSESSPITANVKQQDLLKVAPAPQASPALIDAIDKIGQYSLSDTQSFGTNAAQHYLQDHQNTRALIAILPNILFEPSPSARFVLAKTLCAQERAEPCIDILSRLLQEQDSIILYDIFYYHRALAYISLQQYENAIADLLQVQSWRASPYYHEAKYLHTQCLYDAQRYHEAKPVLDAFIATYPEHPKVAKLRLQSAICLISLDDQQGAARELNNIAFDFPWMPEAQIALSLMEDLNYKVVSRSLEESVQRIDFLRRKRFWVQAQDAITPLLAQYPNSIALLWQNARLAYDQSMHKEAIPLLWELKERMNNKRQDGLSPSTVNAYLAQAHIYEQELQKAQTVFEENLQNYPKAQAAQRLQTFYAESGQFIKAFDLMMEQKLSTQKKSKNKKKNAIELSFDEAFLAYLAQKYDVAESSFQAILRSSSSAQKPQILYWLAQTQAKQNKNEIATQNYTQILQQYPLKYYAILAKSRLWDLEHEVVAVANNIAWNQYDNNTLSLEKIDETYQNLPDDVEIHFLELIQEYSLVFPNLHRVSFFDKAGLHDERGQELRDIALEFFALEARYRQNGRLPNSTKPWALRLSMDGFLVDNRKNPRGIWGIELSERRFTLPKAKDKTALKAAAERQRAILQDSPHLRQLLISSLIYTNDYYLAKRYSPLPRSNPGAVESLHNWSILYPRAFNEALRGECEAQGLFPYLLWTVMNIESAFNPDSVSHADAYGLMQVIPITGYKLASALAVTDFGPLELVQPKLSIRMGAYYLAQIIQKFHGNELLALAGYNGGPHQVARWLKSYGQNLELDAFVELIVYNEARHYVKKGMERLLLYKKIYDNDPDAMFYISNQLIYGYLSMPNY